MDKKTILVTGAAALFAASVTTAAFAEPTTMLPVVPTIKQATAQFADQTCAAGCCAAASCQACCAGATQCCAAGCCAGSED